MNRPEVQTSSSPLLFQPQVQTRNLASPYFKYGLPSTLARRTRTQGWETALRYSDAPLPFPLSKAKLTHWTAASTLPTHRESTNGSIAFMECLTTNTWIYIYIYTFPRTKISFAKLHGQVNVNINVTDGEVFVTMTKTLLHGKLPVTQCGNPKKHITARWGR